MAGVLHTFLSQSESKGEGANRLQVNEHPLALEPGQPRATCRSTDTGMESGHVLEAR